MKMKHITQTEKFIYFIVSVHNRLISIDPLQPKDRIDITYKIQQFTRDATDIITIKLDYLHPNDEFLTAEDKYPNFELHHDDFLFNTERLIYYLIHLHNFLSSNPKIELITLPKLNNEITQHTVPVIRDLCKPELYQYQSAKGSTISYQWYHLTNEPPTKIVTTHPYDEASSISTNSNSI